MGAGVQADWPLVGRDEELGAALEVLQSGRSGVVLVGGAGVGKSRLAREVLARSASEGSSTVWAVATRSTSNIPFGALVSILPDHLPAVDDQLTLFRSLAGHLAQQAEGARLVIAVDDAHLLDDAGSGLVHQLAVTGQAQVVLTVRSLEPAPDAITALWTDGLLERFELEPLGQPEVADLMGRVLGGRIERSSAQRLWRVTGGNPLFLRELVLDTARCEGFDRAGEVVMWRRPITPGQRLDDLLSARLDGVGPGAAAAARLVALGEPVGYAVLEDLTTTEALVELEELGIIRLDRGEHRTEVRFVHPLWGEVLRARIGAIEGRQLRRRLALALSKVDARRWGDSLRLATLELDADLPLAPARMLEAAREARRICDYPLAERLARAALSAEPTNAAAVLAVGEAVNGQERYGEANAILATAESQWADDQQRVRAAEERSLALQSGLLTPKTPEPSCWPPKAGSPTPPPGNTYGRCARRRSPPAVFTRRRWRSPGPCSPRTAWPRSPSSGP